MEKKNLKEESMNKTKIEWVKNPDGSQGFTSNPFTGCLNGCPYCYARRESHGRCKHADLSGYALEKGHDDDPFYPRYHPERLLDIVARKKPAGIFLNDRSDGFADYWPRNYQDDIRETIELCPQHRFYLLTKQPQNLIKFSPFPGNCWVGVTATSLPMFVEACLLLGDIQASVKYLSIEPFLSWGDYAADETAIEQWAKGLTLYGINQVIIGSQTKPYKPPKIEWVDEIVRACDKAGVPVFLKKNLAKALPFFKEPFKQETMGDDGIKIVGLRQEMPIINV